MKIKNGWSNKQTGKLFSDRRFLYLSLILLIPGDLPDFTLLGVDFMKRGREASSNFELQRQEFEVKPKGISPRARWSSGRPQPAGHRLWRWREAKCWGCSTARKFRPPLQMSQSFGQEQCVFLWRWRLRRNMCQYISNKSVIPPVTRRGTRKKRLVTIWKKVIHIVSFRRES